VPSTARPASAKPRSRCAGDTAPANGSPTASSTSTSAASTPTGHRWTPGEALDRFLRALGHNTGQLPADLEERAALYRSTLADKRILVLLDNAATVDQVRLLLPGTSTGLVLVTSRNQLTGLVAVDGAHNLTLDVLNPVESALLLEKILGPARVTAEPEAASELAALCGHLPLALRVAAGKLVMRPSLPISTSVDELRHARLAALEVDGDRRAAVRAAFDLSYLALKPDEQSLFRRLGLVPGPDFTPAVAAVLADLPDAGRLLARLVGVHLVDSPNPDRYRLHDLLRRYARERCETDESPSDRDRAMTRLLAWYLGTAQTAVSTIHPHSQQLYDYTTATGSFPDGVAALTWLEAERANLTAAIDDSVRRDQPDTALRLIDAVRGYFIARAHYHEDWQTLTRTGLRAAEQLDDDRARAAMHLNLAVACYGLTDLDAYLRHAATALDLARSAGWDLGTARALTFLGHGNMERGHPGKALDYLDAARAALPENSAPQLSYLLLIQAHTHHELGDLEVSRDLFDEVVRIGEELDSLPDQTLGWYGLGLVHMLLGEPDQAWAAFSDSVRTAKALHNCGREAVGLAGLAEVAAAAGRHAEASELLETGRTAASTSHNQHFEVVLAMAAGRAHAAAADWPAAIAEFTAALTLTRKIGYRYDTADILLELAPVYRALHDPRTARACAIEALEVASEAGFRVLTEKARSWLLATDSTA
jgi:tetratricopeptide (TPR) repeat protein